VGPLLLDTKRDFRAETERRFADVLVRLGVYNFKFNHLIAEEVLQKIKLVTEIEFLLPALDEANRRRFFTEALTAKIKTVLANETSLMRAEAALPTTLPVFAWAREPNSVVCHTISMLFSC